MQPRNRWLGPIAGLAAGLGLAALASSNYRLLRNLLYMNIRQDDYSEEEPVVAKIHHQEVLEYEMQKKVLGNLRTPLSDHLYEALRVPLKEYLPGDKKYDETFNWFEYLLGLCHCDSQMTRPQLAENLKNPHYHAWAPVGRYAWKNSSPGILVETEVMKGKPYPEKVAALVRDGFFESGGQHEDKFIQVKEAFDRGVQTVRNKWMFR